MRQFDKKAPIDFRSDEFRALKVFADLIYQEGIECGYLAVKNPKTVLELDEWIAISTAHARATCDPDRTDMDLSWVMGDLQDQKEAYEDGESPIGYVDNYLNRKNKK